MSGGEGDLSQLADGNNADGGQASYYDDNSEIPMTSGNQTGSKIDRTASVREFFLDVGLSN